MLVNLLEEVYDIKLNFRAFSFYPNYLYFGMPLNYDYQYRQKTKPLWQRIKQTGLIPIKCWYFLVNNDCQVPT